MLDLMLVNGTALNGGVDFGSSTTGNIEVSTDNGVTWTFGTSVTIAAGSTGVLARTPVVDDSEVEPTEDFSFSVTVTAGTTANTGATSSVTLVDNDAPAASIADVAVTEGVDGFATFVIDLSSASFEDIVVDLSLNDVCLLYTSPSPRDLSTSRMPSSA